MKLEHDGVEITLNFDDDGFPYVDISLYGYEGDNHRPTVEVSINGEVIHPMFHYNKEDDYYTRYEMEFNEI